MDKCPLCGRSTYIASARLIRDACGHTKCRLCLLHEENGCTICMHESSMETPQRVFPDNYESQNEENCTAMELADSVSHNLMQNMQEDEEMQIQCDQRNKDKESERSSNDHSCLQSIQKNQTLPSASVEFVSNQVTDDQNDKLESSNITIYKILENGNLTSELLIEPKEKILPNSDNQILQNHQSESSPSKTPNHLTECKSPGYELSEYLLLKKKNYKRSENEFLSPAQSIGDKSPDFKISDYLLFKKSSISNEQVLEIESENKIKNKKEELSKIKINNFENNGSDNRFSNAVNNSLSEQEVLQYQYKVVTDSESNVPEMEINTNFNNPIENNHAKNCKKLNNSNEPNFVDNSLTEKILNLPEDLKSNNDEEKKEMEQNDEDKENKDKSSAIVESKFETKNESTVRKNTKVHKTAEEDPSVIKNKRKNKSKLNKKNHVQASSLKEKKRKKKSKILVDEDEKLEIIKKPAVKRRKPNKDWSHIIVLPSNPVTYKCTVCGKVFKSFRCRCYHSACVLGKLPFQCTICDRTFAKRSHFEYHERMHSGDKPFQCDMCGKSFIQKNKLNRHLFVHKQQNDIECNECGKKFSTKQYLKNHMTTHTKNAFKCRFCPKVFTFDPNRKRHERSHSSDRPFKCDICSKSFKVKSLMTRHKKTHEKSRPFSCHNCNKVFLSKFEVQRHMAVHSDLKPYNCEHCSLKFRRKDNLHRHIKHHHPCKEQGSIDNIINVHKDSTQHIENSPEKKPIKKNKLNSKKDKLTQTKKKSDSEIKKTPKASTKNKTRKASKSNSVGSKSLQQRAAEKGKSRNTFQTIRSPISIQKFVFENNKSVNFSYTDPIPRKEALDLNRLIEEKISGQSPAFSSFTNFSFHASPARKRESGSSVTTTDGDSSWNRNEKNNELLKTEESAFVKKDTYMHWRRRTAESLKSNIRKR